MKTTIPPEVLKFFKENATTIDLDKRYYYFPFWIEDNDDGTVVMHSLGKLPDKLNSAIREFRKAKFKP